MPRARDMACQPSLRDGGARDKTDAAPDSCPAGATVDCPISSPPLSPEELADIEAIASGAVKLRRMSKSEFIRMITDAAKPKVHVENRTP